MINSCHPIATIGRQDNRLMSNTDKPATAGLKRFTGYISSFFQLHFGSFQDFLDAPNLPVMQTDFDAMRVRGRFGQDIFDNTLG